MGTGATGRIIRRDSVSPHELELLLPREREVATAVYAMRSATAEQVLEKLSKPLANASVRSMLNRLVDKGILKRELRGRVYYYQPSLSVAESRMRAMTRFIEDHFNGSAALATATISNLLPEAARMP